MTNTNAEIVKEIEQFKYILQQNRNLYHSKREKYFDFEQMYKQKATEIADAVAKLELSLIIDSIMEQMKQIKNYELLSLNEIHVIVEGMDKGDWTLFGVNIPRWIHLNKITKKAIATKQRFSDFELVKVSDHGASEDIEPPRTTYKLEYKNSHNDIIHNII
jgi:hypothetical protein